jgi:hypothetical protein
MTPEDAIAILSRHRPCEHANAVEVGLGVRRRCRDCGADFDPLVQEQRQRTIARFDAALNRLSRVLDDASRPAT